MMNLVANSYVHCQNFQFGRGTEKVERVADRTDVVRSKEDGAEIG